MSELVMECVEEELEPWQKTVPQINLTEDDDDDDDEPIFVGVVSEDKTENDSKTMVTPRKCEEKQTAMQPSLQPSTGPSSLVAGILLPSVAGKPDNTAIPAVPAITPKSIIVNNQGFIVTPPMTNSNFITTLGTPGSSFTFVSAQPQVFQQISPPPLIQGVVQQINSNIVTLSKVQSPTVFNTKSSPVQVKQTNTPLPLNRSPKSSNYLF
ncbi:hypothetical protein WMY93_013297 [Mugilogobius chulae]|uniref:Uncharacterized protein n=1 Tax=Mugilogobius chulae TaxID=88201 RepID=A0AAW0NZJ3_9GOBI